jgi:hypothetical protein
MTMEAVADLIVDHDAPHTALLDDTSTERAIALEERTPHHAIAHALTLATAHARRLITMSACAGTR